MVSFLEKWLPCKQGFATLYIHCSTDISFCQCLFHKISIAAGRRLGKESKLSFYLALLLQFNTIYAKIGIIVNSFPCFALNPLFFVRSGDVNRASFIVQRMGYSSVLWSSTAIDEKEAYNSYPFLLFGTSISSGLRNRGWAYSLRCLAIE